MNVSLPPAMERFVRHQVESGRYRSASEVVRDGLRLLEQAEQQRLIEKWLFEDLTAAESDQLPESLKQRVRNHFSQLVNDARSDVDAGRVTEGSAALDRIEARLRARLDQKP